VTIRRAVIEILTFNDRCSKMYCSSCAKAYAMNCDVIILALAKRLTYHSSLLNFREFWRAMYKHATDFIPTFSRMFVQYFGCYSQGRRSLWDGGDTSPQLLRRGDTIMNVPPPNICGLNLVIHVDCRASSTQTSNCFTAISQ
jgi:hypothetical protein